VRAAVRATIRRTPATRSADAAAASVAPVVPVVDQQHVRVPDATGSKARADSTLEPRPAGLSRAPVRIKSADTGTPSPRPT